MSNAFRKLNERSKDFGPFIESLVRILADKKEDIKIRVAAAKEIHRRLGSQSMFISEIQEEKWKKLDNSFKNGIKSSVSGNGSII